MKSLLAALLILATASRLISCNPTLKDLTSDRYEVDQIMKIDWTPEPGHDTPTTFLTIDVVNDRPEVLVDSFMVVDGVSASQLSYSWTIPRYLKSSDEYHLRIYYQGQASPRGVSESGYGKSFQLINPNPMRQSTLNLIEPTGSSDGTNLESTCLVGEQCSIVWDYPPWAESAMPKLIDIKLYSGDHVVIIIAQGIPVGSKSIIWQVPSVVTSDPVHVVISASDKKIDAVQLQPGRSFYLASSGYPFVLESRSEREQRRSADSKPRADLNTPGPIQSNTTMTTATALDIPRPTYAPAEPPKDPADSKSSASVPAKQSVSFSILVSSLIVVLMIQ